jgi:hypothetical protein
MADYTYCLIEIGGSIPVRIIEALSEAAENDRVDDLQGFDEHDNANRSLAEALVEAERRGTYIAFSGAEVSGGYADEVAAVCAEHRVIYRMRSAERYEIPNRIEYFDGTTTRLCPATSSDLEAAVTVQDLSAAVDTGVSLEKLIEMYRVFVEDLPPVEIVP